MAARETTDWPSNDEVVKLARKTGAKERLSREIGVAPSTLRSYLDRNSKLAERVETAIGAHRREAQEQAAKERSAVPKPADEKPDEIEVLRHRNRELESANRTYRKGSVLDEIAVQRFQEAFGNVKPRYSPLVIPKQQKKSKHEHILLFSDAHANEVVSYEETMGLNAYDWDVMLKRMARIQKSVLSFQANRPYPIQKLHVAMLGDNVSGDIHDELVETNEMPHEESVVQFALDTSHWLEEFVPHYEYISVSGVPGNHPRRAKKPTAKMAFNNSDWVAYQFIQSYFRKHETFSFNFAKAKFTEIMVAERWRGLLLHGDGVRSTMVDVPWGGIIRYIGKLARQYVAAGKPVDFFALGHWHEINQVMAGGPGVKTFINGTIKGLDEYSLQRFGGGGPPAQTLLTVHPKHGITDVSYLDCEEAVPAGERLAA